MRSRTPLTNADDSAGAFVPAGVGGLDGYSEAFCALRKISGVVPSISLMFGYNAGGGAYLPRQGSFMIQCNDTFIGLTGPAVVKSALGENPKRVYGDQNRLAQVIGNLLSNGIKYSPDGGVVRITGEPDGDVVRVSVRDEGVGIPEDQQAQIFTKFFRGDAAASGIAGSGLGLAFARAVVEAHGGRMSFTSAVGQGSTFRIELPRSEPIR